MFIGRLAIVVVTTVLLMELQGQGCIAQTNQVEIRYNVSRKNTSGTSLNHCMVFARIIWHTILHRNFGHSTLLHSQLLTSIQWRGNGLAEMGA